ncbi:MAG: hypothetical protein OXI22_00020 [Defluviicoccus sp.]|nr:hypothetical protein [Defluviicoccus sp.]
MALLLAQYGTPLLLVVGFLWLRSDLRRVEGKVDNLAKDHQALGRELSELKGRFDSIEALVVRQAGSVTPAE